MLNKNIIYTLAISAAILINAGTAIAAPVVVTSDNLRKLLIENNDQLKIQEENKKVADYRLKAAEAIYNPSLTLDTSYSQANQSLSGQQLGVSKTLSNKFTYNQILYANAKVKNSVELALISTYGSSVAYDQTYNETIYQTYNAYYQAAKAKELLKVAQKSYDQTKSRLEVTKRQLSGAVGDKAIVMLGNVKVQLMTQEQALLRAKQNEILARKNLALMLKKDPNDIEVETKLTEDITKPNNEKNYEIAKENRTEYKQIELAKQTATANKAIADAAYSLLPTVSLVGTYDFKNTNAASLFNPAAGAVDSSTKDWLISINAQWIILDGAKNSNEALAQTAINRQNELNQQATEDKIKYEIDAASFTLETAYEQIKVAQEAVTVSKENLAVAQRLYNNGVGTEADLKDAEASYTQASTNYINAYYDYKLAIVGLNKAIGKL